MSGSLGKRSKRRWAGNTRWPWWAFWLIALSTWLVASLGTAFAGETHDSPSATAADHQNRYDAMWRTPPLPHYIVAMSQDDSLCDSIADAFNDASTPEGAPPGSLYSGPMFVKWEHNPWRLDVGNTAMDVDFTSSDPFNEGTRIPIVRIQSSDARGLSYVLCLFAGEDALSSQNWERVDDVIKDTECKKIFSNDLYEVSVKDSRLIPTFSQEDLNRLPQSEVNRHDLQVPSSLSPGSEVNFIANSDGSELVVLRNAVTEVTLIARFDGRSSPPKNVCLIGPEIAIELP